MSAQPPRLELQGIVRDYPGNRALDEVSLSVQPGEIVGLVGHNGAGKSTVSKVIAGSERADAGTVSLDGAVVELRSPTDAMAHGVGLVPQRLTVVDGLTVRHNMTLGLRGATAAGADARLRDAARELGIEGLLGRRAGRLRPSVQRLVMIGRALLRGPRLLILDEPSAALSSTEVDRLFAIVRRLRERGIAIIYVSHRLEEVLALTDRVVAMAQGRVIADHPSASLTKGALADLIAGRHIDAVDKATATSGAGDRELAVRLRGVSVAPKLTGVDLEVGRGEIVGLTGLVGSGRTTLLNALWGVGGTVSGEVEIGGAPFRPSKPRDAIRRGIAFVPENRARNSLVNGMTVVENVTLPAVRSYRRPGTPLVRRGRERNAVAQVLERLAVHPRGAGPRKVNVLSGGNQQKAIIARWLLLDIDVFLFDEPTEGVDIGGRQDIYDLLRDLARDGKSVLVSSSDVEEVVEQCDRVYVMRGGMIAEELTGASLTLDRVSRACLA